MTEAEIAGIMGWRGPGAYTERQMKKVKQVVSEATRQEREEIERLNALIAEMRKALEWASDFVPPASSKDCNCNVCNALNQSSPPATSCISV